MELYSALDAFAAVIKIGEKDCQSICRYSKGLFGKERHAMAGETTTKGKEMTEVAYFDDLKRMYGKVNDCEDTIRKIAEFLKRKMKRSRVNWKSAGVIFCQKPWTSSGRSWDR